MEYGQFIKILEGENLNRKETIEQLKDIILQYPHFQTAHILLAKALKEQNNIDFDRALKLAAVYSGDRSNLYDYINKKGVKVIEPEIAESISYREENNQQEEVEVKKEESVIPGSNFILEDEEPYKEYYSDEELMGIDEAEEKEEKIYDPHDLIRKRLSEILEHKTEAEEEVKEKVLPTNKIEEVSPIDESIINIPEIKVEDQREEIKPEASSQSVVFTESIPDKEQIIIQEAAKADDVLSRMEVEYAMESSILESLEKLPPIEKETKLKEPEVRIEEPKEIAAEKGDTLSPRSFTEWLKSISPKPFHNYQEVHSPIEQKQYGAADVDGDEVESASNDELIDKFIEADPKIVPSKMEFYSPANQAKKSIMEHEDIVSETLAKIYRQQGNLEKARWCYQRLSLLFPEKSAFFAALLKEIDEINKEDL
jgi:hypothetical protein